MRDGFHYKFWTYILTSRTGTLYVGVTGYFDRRIMQHKMDTIEGFTKKYKVHRLVYYESFNHAANAISREKQLKGWRRLHAYPATRDSRFAQHDKGFSLCFHRRGPVRLLRRLSRSGQAWCHTSLEDLTISGG